MFGGIFRKKTSGRENLGRKTMQRIGQIRENSVPGGISGRGPAFVRNRQQGAAACGPRKKRGPAYTHFLRAGPPAYLDQLADYVRHIPLLMRDLDFQFHYLRKICTPPLWNDTSIENICPAAGRVQKQPFSVSCGGETENAAEPFDSPEFPDSAEDSLEVFAITAHGIKFSSCGIMAMETGKKAADLENAALMGDFDFLMKKTPEFLEYMDYFIEGLEQFLEKEKGFRKY